MDSALKTFYDAGARLKLAKCQFGVRSAEILGQKIDKDGIKTSDAHVSAVRKLVEPGGGEELMRFLGLMNYFAEFVDHFAELAAPLHEALKGTGFNLKKRRGQRLVIPDWQSRWGQRQKRSWQELKDALSSPDVLAPPRRGAKKKLMTDASSYGLGGVLLQMTTEGRWRPVSFTSRKLTDAERKFTVTEKECLAVVHALRKWRFYLHGEEDVVVITDHCSLKWLMSLKDPRGRLARWMVDVQDFEFTVKYAPGSALVVPDALSRDSVEKPLCQRCYKEIPQGAAEETALALMDVGSLGGGPSSAEVREAQREQLGDLGLYARGERSKGYHVDETGILRKQVSGQAALVVPDKLVPQILDQMHGSRVCGHYSLRRTLKRLQGLYLWKGWRRDAQEKLARCRMHCRQGLQAGKARSLGRVPSGAKI